MKGKTVISNYNYGNINLKLQNGISEEAMQRFMTKTGGEKDEDARRPTPLASAAIAREYMSVLLDRLKKRAKTVLYDEH